MSYQPQFPGIFSFDQGAVPAQDHDDAPVLPATEKQMHYALSLASKAGLKLPDGIASDRAALSAWIDAHMGYKVGGERSTSLSGNNFRQLDRFYRHYPERPTGPSTWGAG